MVQKLSIDPKILDYKFLENSLNKIDKGFQNLTEIKKMENPTIFLNSQIADELIKNMSELKILLNNKVSDGEEFRKLSNTSNKIEIHLQSLLNSPEKVYKFNDKNISKLEFKKFITFLFEKFGISFLDFVLLSSKINSGFLEIDNYLAEYLENKSQINRDFSLRKDIKNFIDFERKILETLGIHGHDENEKLFLINPGILRKIDNNDKNYLGLLITIKSICCYFYKKIDIFKLRPKIVVITDNANYVGKENSLRIKFLKEFEDLEKHISVDLIVLNRWEKKSQSEQRFIFSSNEVGYGLNIEIDFMATGKFGSKKDDLKFIENNYKQLKVVKSGILKEIISSNLKEFLRNNIINKANNNENSLKNPIFREILQKYNNS